MKALNRMLRLIYIFLVFAWTTPLWAAETLLPPLSATAPSQEVVWLKQPSGMVLNVKLTDYLSTQQKELINSGFSTFSQLTIYEDNPGLAKALARREGGGIKPLWSISCSVKFDTWEERYEVVRLEKDVRPEQAKDFSVYSDLCLGLQVKSGDDWQRFQKTGGKLRAFLVLDQIAADQAAQIKDWLVKQQSGIIQGLFSHMLGDFKLSEKLDITLHVPPAARFSANTAKGDRQG